MTIDKKECLIWPIVWPKLGSVRKNFPNTVLCFSHKLVFDLVPRKELKKDLPSQFVKAFLKRHGFHSWTYFVNFGSGDATSCFFKFQVLACQVQFNMMLHHLHLPANYGGVFGMGTICVRSSTVLAALQCIVFWPFGLCLWGLMLG